MARNQNIIFLKQNYTENTVKLKWIENKSTQANTGRLRRSECISRNDL